MSIIDVKDTYRVYRDNLGVVNAVNRISDGASLLYYPRTREFDELHPMTVELREWEEKVGEPLDLTDHEPDQPPPDDDGGDDNGGGDVIF